MVGKRFYITRRTGKLSAADIARMPEKIRTEAIIAFTKIHVRQAYRKLTEINYAPVRDMKELNRLTNERLKNFYPLTNIQ